MPKLIILTDAVTGHNVVFHPDNIVSFSLSSVNHGESIVYTTNSTVPFRVKETPDHIEQSFSKWFLVE
jgi:hypothetical protein